MLCIYLQFFSGPISNQTFAQATIIGVVMMILNPINGQPPFVLLSYPVSLSFQIFTESRDMRSACILQMCLYFCCWTRLCDIKLLLIQFKIANSDFVNIIFIEMKWNGIQWNERKTKTLKRLIKILSIKFHVDGGVHFTNGCLLSCKRVKIQRTKTKSK